MQEPRGQELIDRYKQLYGDFGDIEITEEMILRHWELEKALTKELLESIPETRWETFDRCYTILYSELPWLNQFTEAQAKRPDAQNFGHWLQLIGSPPKRVFEIGSGRGQLIRYLAKCGYECKGTEITRERGERWVEDTPNITWSNTDGIHLADFESEKWDVAISNHVIEHMHPDDVIEHFRGVYSILTDEGKYIFCLPHWLGGPGDVSAVFKCDRTRGMHLKEYTYAELAGLMKKAGFRQVSCPLRIPVRIQLMLKLKPKSRGSKMKLAYLICCERILALLPTQSSRRTVSEMLEKVRLFSTNIFFIAEK